MPRRVVIGTYVLPDTNSNVIAPTYSTGFSGGGTAGYLRARGGNSAALYIAEDSDASDEPRIRLAAGETFPILVESERLATLRVKGAASDVVEFIADASE
jgi:hypothetical protein